MLTRNYEGSEILPSLQVSHRFTDAGRNTRLVGSLCSPVRRIGHKEPYYLQTASSMLLPVAPDPQNPQGQHGGTRVDALYTEALRHS